LSPFQAVILAIVQGVTEFLPISSSGHLILVPRLFGWPDQGLDFDIATNTGTLLAVLLYFRRDLRDLVAGFLSGRARSRDGTFEPRPMALKIVLGTVPAVLAGLLLKHWIESAVRGNLWIIAGTTLGYGLLLGLADRIGRQTRSVGDLGWGDALLIGCAQALALIPGTSRSGATITAGLLLGLRREAAARFSFLLSVPVGVAVAAKSLFDLRQAGGAPAGFWFPTLLALAVSALVGYLVIAWLLAFIRRQKMTVFVVYRVGLALLIVVVLGLR
jgi:undecaprenyl-diphosphatase